MNIGCFLEAWDVAAQPAVPARDDRSFKQH